MCIHEIILFFVQMRRRCRRAIFLRRFGTVSTSQRQLHQRFPNCTPTHTMPMHPMHRTPMTHGLRITNNTQQQRTTTGNIIRACSTSPLISAIYGSMHLFILGILEPSTNTITITTRWHNTEVYFCLRDYRITRSTNRP